MFNSITLHKACSRRGLLASAITALLLSSTAQAGVATVQSSEGESATFEYADNLLRINTKEDGVYMVIREGTMYVVNMQGEQPMVMNASSMMRGIANSATQFAPDDLSGEFESMKDTGRDETVAGIKGDVYLLTFTDGDGERQEQEVVLARNALAREFRDALFSMAAMAGDLAGEKASQQSDDLRARLDKLNAGILRVGEDMRVTAISGDSVPAERFALPAEPMDMQGLGSMLGAAMAQQPQSGDSAAGSGNQQGGILGGMLGAFGKKAADEDQSEEAAEDEDEAKQNPLKALGKLFGKKDNN